MPWGPGDAEKKDHAANTPAKQKQWAEVANSVLKRTGNEGLAVREASGVIRRHEGHVKH